MIHPKGHWVLLKRVVKEERINNTNKIILPEKQSSPIYEVIEVGDKGEGFVSVGDKVLLENLQDVKFTHEGQEYVLIYERSIIAKVE